MSLFLKVRKVSTQEQVATDFIWVNPNYSNLGIVTIRNHTYDVGFDKSVGEDEIAINAVARVTLDVSLGEMLEVPYPVRVLHTSVAPLDQEVGQIGVTVRNGIKWMGYQGEFIDLCECISSDKSKDMTHFVTGRGKILNKGTCAFRDVPARIVELEHCADARTYSGLLEAMKRAYSNFTEQNIVTWIEYVRIV